MKWLYIVIILVCIAMIIGCIIYGDHEGPLTDEEYEARARGYRVKRVVVPIVAGAVLLSFTGFCLFTKINEWLMARRTKKNKKP